MPSAWQGVFHVPYPVRITHPALLRAELPQAKRLKLVSNILRPMQNTDNIDTASNGKIENQVIADRMATQTSFQFVSAGTHMRMDSKLGLSLEKNKT